MARTSYRLLTRLTVAAVCQIMGVGPAASLPQIGPESDAAIEDCLRSGRIMRGRRPLKGVTHPVQVELDCDGQSRLAVLKTLHSFRRGLTRLGDGSREMNFIDSYKLERAAYLVDRELGLNMVPVAVIRDDRSCPGALVDWIPHASHQNDLEPPLTSAEVAALAHQKTVMHLFDALIYNTDRSIKNWLIDHDRRTLYLIDHSRSFRLVNELPEWFLGKRVWLTREVHAGLIRLRRERLRELLDGLVERGQIDALLDRRDQLLDIIDVAIRELGETAVFSD